VEEGLAVFSILIGASLVIFVLFVAPIWVFLHYRHQRREDGPPVRASVGLSAADAADLNRLAERMEQRVTALEAIMDAEAPGWRSKS
jgi:phage shock protein B